MYKKIFLILAILILAQAAAKAQSGSYAGSFARMGFGARGLAMGNAMVSDIFGDVNGYYNPSLACFQDEGYLNLGYTAMTLDRRLNYIGFAKKFKMPKNDDGGAGISLSWINAGVSKIDGRDNDGNELGDLSTFENQFYLGTGFLIDKNFAFGVGFKLYYSKLYDEVKTNSVGFDIGAIYRLRPDLSLGFALRDLGARYKWETNKIYGELGTTTENRFPVLADIGATYLLPNNFGTASVEFETVINPRFETKDTVGTITKSDRTYNYVIKAGTEIRLSEQLRLRAGIDRMDLKSDDFFGNIKPGFGVGFYKSFGKDMKLGLDYSFQLEPYSHDGIHNVSIGFKFK